jgi:predicted nucleic acid-binding protein
MPKLKIVGYETGLKKVAMTKLLQETLELDAENSQKMSDAILSRNVISLDFEDAEFAENLAAQLEESGARVEIEADEEK